VSGPHNDPVEEFHARGRTAVLAGEAEYCLPPSAGSAHWGLSVILRPDTPAAERLAAVTAALTTLAGPGHWPSGRHGAGHLTVRGLEPYRDPVPLDDPLVDRYAAAVTRAGERATPLTFAMTGLVLVPGGVLVIAEPIGGSPTALRAVLATELGSDGGFEDDDYRRGLWWATSLHFAKPLGDGAALVEWVEARRSLDLGQFRPRSLDLVRYAYDGFRTAPVTLASVPLEG
jgi:hypothetical protein